MIRFVSITVMVLLLTSFGATNAQAGILIDPFIGYETGDADGDDVTGTTYGARLGVSTLGFMGGFEYSLASMTVETNAGDRDYDLKDMGVFFGFNFPILLRVYGTYFFSTEADGSSDYEGSSGYRVGVGYTGLPFISLNLELISRTYDELNGSGISDVTYDTTALTVSLPLP